MGGGAYRTTDTCARCGAAIDTTRAAFSADGQICPACEARENSIDSFQSTEFWGFGPLGWSLVAFVCNPCLIFSILGIVGGFRELRTLRAFGADGPGHQNARTKAIAAIVLGFVHPALIVVIVGFSLIRAAVAPEPRYEPYYDDPLYEPYEAEEPADQDDPVLPPEPAPPPY